MKKLALALVAVAALASACTWGPGTWHTGPGPLDLHPGVYHTPGNAPGSPLCTWERDDRTGNPIGGGWAHSGPQYAQIEPSTAGDVNFTTRGCQPWETDTGKGYTTPPLNLVFSGEYRVNLEINPGEWASNSNAPSCHWQRLRDFRGEAASIIQEGGTIGPVIAPTDVGFRATDCFLHRIG